MIRIITEPVKVFFQCFKTCNNSSRKDIRKDLQVVSINNHMRFLVYWKDLPIGKGPATVLEVNGKEFSKYDCFGRNEGHFHVLPNYNFRIFYHEASREEQIERTAKELLTTTQLYLSWHPNASFNSIIIDRKKFEKAVEKVQKIMNSILKDIS